MKPRHTPIQVGQLTIQFIAAAQDTEGGVSMFECTIPPGARVPVPHHHVEVEEVVYGLSGTLTMRVGDEVHELRAGDSVVVPKGVIHHFDNRHAEPARMLTVQTPGKIGPAYYQEMGEVINAGGPPDPASLKAIMQRHGLEPVAPKPASV